MSLNDLKNIRPRQLLLYLTPGARIYLTASFGWRSLSNAVKKLSVRGLWVHLNSPHSPCQFHRHNSPKVVDISLGNSALRGWVMQVGRER